MDRALVPAAGFFGGAETVLGCSDVDVIEPEADTGRAVGKLLSDFLGQLDLFLVISHFQLYPYLLMRLIQILIFSNSTCLFFACSWGCCFVLSPFFAVYAVFASLL